MVSRIARGHPQGAAATTGASGRSSWAWPSCRASFSSSRSSRSSWWPAATSGSDQYVVFPLLYLLLIPVFTPPTLAAYTIAGEREQGTLEPLLTTPTPPAGVHRRQGGGGDDPDAGAVVRDLRASSSCACGCSRIPLESHRRCSTRPILVAMVVLTPLLAALVHLGRDGCFGESERGACRAAAGHARWPAGDCLDPADLARDDPAGPAFWHQVRRSFCWRLTWPRCASSRACSIANAS